MHRAAIIVLTLLALSGCASLRDLHPTLQPYEYQCCDGGGNR